MSAITRLGLPGADVGKPVTFLPKGPSGSVPANSPLGRTTAQAVPTDAALVKANRFITQVWLDWFTRPSASELIQDTRAHRTQYAPASNTNRIYREIDTDLAYVSTGTAWVYLFGEYRRTQLQLAAVVATLGPTDAGLIFNVTDYKHRLAWDGAALDFASGDDGSNYFIDAPSAPIGKIVQLCDGTTVTYLKADGTTGSYTTQNLTGHYRKSVTSGADATAAAIAPTSGALTFTGIPGITGNDSDVGSRAAVGGGGDPLLAFNPHGHTILPDGAVSTPVISNTAEPAAYKVLTYFRR